MNKNQKDYNWKICSDDKRSIIYKSDTLQKQWVETSNEEKSCNCILASDTNDSIEPCAVLKDVVETCASIVQVSYNPIPYGVGGGSWSTSLNQSSAIS